MPFWRRAWLPVLLLIAAALPLWRSLFLGETIGPWNHIAAIQGAAKPEQPWDVLQADAALQFFPWRDLVFEAWGKGQVPGWNPYVLGGTPLLANSQSGGLYPPHILMGVLHVPTSLAITLLAWLHLAWAGLGIYILTRRLGASEIGAAVGGVAFPLSSFMVSWVGLASVPTTVSWIPWVLASLVWVYGSPSLKSAAALASSVGMMLLAGHLQFAAFGMMAATLAIIILGFGAPLRKTGFAIAALLGGGLIAYPQLSAVLVFSKISHRANDPTKAGWDAYAASALRPADLVGVAHPYTFGNPREAVFPASQFYPAIERPGANFAEMALSLGSVVLALVLLANWRSRPGMLLGSVAIFGALIAFGTPIAQALYYLFPGWSSTGSPGRAIVLLVMALCGMAAFGADRLATLSPRTRLFSLVGVTIWLSLGIASLKSGATAAWSGVAGPQQGASVAASTMLSNLPLFGLALACVGVALFARRRELVIAAVVLCAVSGGALSLVMTGTMPPARIAAEQPMHRIAIENDKWNLYMIPEASEPPNLNILNRMMAAGGYDSLMDRETVDTLNLINGRNSSPPENGNMIFTFPSASKEALAEFGVTEILLKNGERKALAGPGMVTGGELVSIGPNSFSIKPTATEVTFRDRNTPGWEAFADGKEVAIAKGFWKSVSVPTGTQTIEFRYRTPSPWLSLVLLLVALVLLSLRDKKNARSQIGKRAFGKPS